MRSCLKLVVTVGKAAAADCPVDREKVDIVVVAASEAPAVVADDASLGAPILHAVGDQVDGRRHLERGYD